VTPLPPPYLGLFWTRLLVRAGLNPVRYHWVGPTVEATVLFGIFVAGCLVIRGCS